MVFPIIAIWIRNKEIANNANSQQNRKHLNCINALRYRVAIIHKPKQLITRCNVTQSLTYSVITIGTQPFSCTGFHKSNSVDNSYTFADTAKYCMFTWQEGNPKRTKSEMHFRIIGTCSTCTIMHQGFYKWQCQGIVDLSRIALIQFLWQQKLSIP